MTYGFVNWQLILNTHTCKLWTKQTCLSDEWFLFIFSIYFQSISMDARKTLLCSRCLAACQRVREDLVFISAFDSDFLIFSARKLSSLLILVSPKQWGKNSQYNEMVKINFFNVGFMLASCHTWQTILLAFINSKSRQSIFSDTNHCVHGVVKNNFFGNPDRSNFFH